MESKIIAKIKKGVKFTNCYLPIPILQKKISNNELKVIVDKSFLGLIEKSHYNFSYLYFYIEDILNFELENIFKNSDELLILDVIYSERKKEKWELIFQNFYKNGFKKHTSFVRMLSTHNLVKRTEYKNSQIRMPKEHDLILIKEFLEKYFDVFSERIPNLAELKTLLETTFLIKKGNEIAALLISEKKGLTEELRYWIVSEKYRGKGYGSILMRYFLNHNPDTMRFLLWVQENNFSAIKKYQYFGFEKDNLKLKILKK